MSKLNLVILTLCAIGSVILLLVFPFYVSLTLILPIVLCFLYTDYKIRQSTVAGREHSHARASPSSLGLGLPSGTDIRHSIRSFCGNISLNMQKYYIGLVSKSPENTDETVPSCWRSQFLNDTLKLNPISNLDENRPRSRPSTTFYIPNGNYRPNFCGDLSRRPIGLTDSTSIPPSDFRNLRISDSPRPMESFLHWPIGTQNSSRPIAPMKSPLGDPCYSRKHQNGSGSPKHIQSIAGPLLASTRYNLSLDSVAYADVTSAGLASRLVKYATDNPATHQHQYSGPGQFPTIQLAKNSRVPVVTRSQVVGRSPVRIRIAPPEFSERSDYNLPHSTHSQILSVLPLPDGLRETPRPNCLQKHVFAPRKRHFAQLEDSESEDEAAKKQCVSDCATRNSVHAEDAATSKRGREESPKENSKTKRTRNNEIFSSLSSSRHLTAGSNKRKQSLDEWSQSGTLMPAGKQAKKSLPSPETPLNSTELPSQLVEMEAMPSTSKTTPPSATLRAGPIPKSEERSSTLMRMSATRMKGVLYQPSGDVSSWVTAETFPESENTFTVEKAKLALEDLKNQRELDAKRRLSSMMSIVGAKEQTAQEDYATTSSFSSVPMPSVALAPTPSLSTPPPYQGTSARKSTDKRVHFADKLTEVKTFTPTWSHPSNDGTASESLARMFGAGNSQQGIDSKATTNTSDKAEESTSAPSSFAFGVAQSQSSGLRTGENLTVKFGTESLNVVSNTGTVDDTKKSEKDLTTHNTLKQSVGFSFGSSPSSTPTPLPSFPVVKSSSVTSTLTSTSVASGQNTNSPSLFGQTTLGLNSPVLSASSQQASLPSTTFSQSTPISSNSLRQTTTSSLVMFGTDPATTVANLSTPTPTSNTTPSFGQTMTSTSAQNISFGAVAASNKPMFGSVSPATFGGSTQPISSLGSPATTAGFSIPVMSAGSGFGTPVLSTSGGFGTTSTASSSGLGTPAIVPSSSGFGSPSIVSASSGFGTPSVVSASSGFGTPSVVSASSAFGTPTTVSTGGGFGSPAVSNKPASSAGLFGFGAATTAQSQSVGFGTQANPVQSGFGGFGGSTTQTTSAFGGKPTVQGGFSFGGSSTTQVSSSANSSMFGGTKTDKQMTTPNFSQNNVSNSQQTADTGDTQAFKIDFSQTSKPSSGNTGFGGMSSVNPITAGNSFGDANKQAINTAQNTFQFGASSAKPFSFGGSAGNGNAAPSSLFGSASSSAAPPNTTQNVSNVFGQSVFGSQIQQPISTNANMLQQKPRGMFSFGGDNAAAQQTANSFAFGANTSSAQPGGFAFGGSPAQSKPTGGFAFGATSALQTTQGNPFGQASQPQQTSSSQAFQFGSAAPASSGGFNFGNATSSSTAPAFGASTANNAFQMGSAPQQHQQSQGQGMFSIGSGSAAPRARTARLMRRQR